MRLNGLATLPADAPGLRPPRSHRRTVKGNFSAELFVDNLLDKRAEVYRFVECTIFGGSGTPICGLKPLANINTPRMIGLRFGQRF